MGWEDFRFNFEGFEDEIFIDQGNSSGAKPHVSAYNRELGLELALLYGTTLLLSAQTRGRDKHGYISTPSNCTLQQTILDEHDPLMIRCIALEWLEEYKSTHGGNQKHERSGQTPTA